LAKRSSGVRRKVMAAIGTKFAQKTSV